MQGISAVPNMVLSIPVAHCLYVTFVEQTAQPLCLKSKSVNAHHEVLWSYLFILWISFRYRRGGVGGSLPTRLSLNIQYCAGHIFAIIICWWGCEQVFYQAHQVISGDPLIIIPGAVDRLYAYELQMVTVGVLYLSPSTMCNNDFMILWATEELWAYRLASPRQY